MGTIVCGMSTNTPWPYASPRRSPRPESHRRPEQSDWAAYPKRMRRRDGTIVEVFGTGALARALGKSSHSIRRWERLGHLPPSPLEQRVAGGPPRRLFLREQIEGIVAIAEQERLAHRKPAALAATDFAARVEVLYARLFDEGA